MMWRAVWANFLGWRSDPWLLYAPASAEYPRGLSGCIFESALIKVFRLVCARFFLRYFYFCSMSAATVGLLGRLDWYRFPSTMVQFFSSLSDLLARWYCSTKSSSTGAQLSLVSRDKSGVDVFVTHIPHVVLLMVTRTFKHKTEYQAHLKGKDANMNLFRWTRNSDYDFEDEPHSWLSYGSRWTRSRLKVERASV